MGDFNPLDYKCINGFFGCVNLEFSRQFHGRSCRNFLEILCFRRPESSQIACCLARVYGAKSGDIDDAIQNPIGRNVDNHDHKGVASRVVSREKVIVEGGGESDDFGARGDVPEAKPTKCVVEHLKVTKQRI